MFVLKGRFMENSEFKSRDGTVIRQAVIYSEGDGTTHKISGVDTDGKKPFDPVEIPVTVSVFDGRLVVRALQK